MGSGVRATAAPLPLFARAGAAEVDAIVTG